MLSADEIVQEMSHTIADKQRDSWCEYVRSAVVLLIDNTHIRIRNEGVLKELVSILRYYAEKGKQAVMTSSVLPESFPILESSLRTDYECDLLADIQPLRPETCRVIAVDRAARQGLWLSEESLKYIAILLYRQKEKYTGLRKLSSAFTQKKN